MRIELFGVARLRAGTDAVEVDALTVGEALRVLAQLCPNLNPEVLIDGRMTEHFLVSLNGELFVSDPGQTLQTEDTLLILGAQAGGSSSEKAAQESISAAVYPSGPAAQTASE